MDVELGVEVWVRVMDDVVHDDGATNPPAMKRSLREGGGIPVLHACSGPSSAPSLRPRTFSMLSTGHTSSSEKQQQQQQHQGHQRQQ